MTTPATTEATVKSLLAIPDGAPWALLAEMPWREGSCRGMISDYEVTRHVYIAMRPPRSARRCQQELDWLGFRDDKKRILSAGTIRSWAQKGDWNREARLHDMGMCSVEELQRRTAGLRDAALMPLVDSLAEVFQATLDAEQIQKAVEKAAEKGDIAAIINSAREAAKLIGYITAGAEETPGPPPVQQHQHQHLHAHMDAESGEAPPPPPPPTGALARVLLTPFTRVIDGLEKKAAEKRAQGVSAKPAATNGAAKANGHSNGHANGDHDDGEH